MQQKIKILMDGQLVKQVDGITRHPDYQRMSSQQKLAHYALTGGSGHQPNDSTAMIGNIGKYKHCVH